MNKQDRYQILILAPPTNPDPFFVAGTFKDLGRARQCALGYGRNVKILDTRTWVFVDINPTDPRQPNRP